MVEKQRSKLTQANSTTVYNKGKRFIIIILTLLLL